MRETKRNLSASVLARLLKRAQETGEEYQMVLVRYCFERFLYRLGTSELRERFVLKGAMLLRLWSGQPYRATRDLDLSRRGGGSFEAVREDMQTIVRHEGAERRPRWSPKRILLPMASVSDIPSVPGELFAKFQTSFYADPKDAVFKALGVD